MASSEHDGDCVRYVAVARRIDRVIVASYVSTDSSALPKRLLETKLQKVLRSARVGEHARLTITDRDVGSIHYDSDSICLYFVVCPRELKQKVAFKFLTETKSFFVARHGSEVESASLKALTSAVQTPLKQLCDKYNNPYERDGNSAVALHLDTAKSQLTENIKHLLESREISENFTGSDSLTAMGASGLENPKYSVPTRTWYKDTKLLLMFFVLVVVLASIFIITLVSGQTSSKR